MTARSLPIISASHASIHRPSWTKTLANNLGITNLKLAISRQFGRIPNIRLAQIAHVHSAA